MAVAALVLYVVWFLLAFGLRSLIQLRRTGDSGFKGLGGRPGSLEWVAGVLFTVSLAIGVAAPVAALAGLDEIGFLDQSWIAWAGLVVASVGVVLTLAAQLSMGNSWRIGVDETERTELVTEGAFTIVRNPIFSAMGFTAVGLAAMVPNVIAVIGLVTMAIAVELQVRRVEEPYLGAVHGQPYLDYRGRVGRFVPGLGRP